jgi:hypothetical protein
MDGMNPIAGAALAGSNSGWSVDHQGDFNGDGKSDLLWRHDDGSVVLWLMNGADVTGQAGLTGPTGWNVKRVGDFNGDSDADIVWQHNDGTAVVWLMNGTTVNGTAGLIGPGSDWTPTP